MSIIQKLDEALAFVKSQTNIQPRLGLTLGSGLASLASSVENPVTIPYNQIPHFSGTKVEGHPGQLIVGTIRQVPVAVLQGRIHFYEGHSMESVMFPTRLLCRWGIGALLLTNASGGMKEGMTPGDFMVIRDHLNMIGENPLRGPNEEELGPRFPDMTGAYDSELCEILVRSFNKHNVKYFDGIYCGVSGPTYESPAEIRAYKMLGASAVGMSTVPETIAARHMGVKVAGVACITNLGAGLSNQKINHDDVKQVAKIVEQSFSSVITDAIFEMGRIIK